MKFSADKVYHKEYVNYQHTLRTKYPYYSLSSLLIINFGECLFYILLLVVVAFTGPFMPNLRYGYGGEVPATFNEYAFDVVGNLTALIGFFGTNIFLVSLIQYLRTQSNYKAGYIMTGNLKVVKIINRGVFKVVRLNDSRKFKIENTSEDFANLRTEQVIEVKKTASNRLISFRLLT